MQTPESVAGSADVGPGVIVCGAPRSGTSMVTEALVDAGFHVGRDLIAGSVANPHGFFEDIEVNRLNDELLDDTDLVADAERPPRSLSWLGAFDVTDARVDRARLTGRIPSSPFVIKDPRFSFTYPAWRPVLGDHRVVVMVRPIAEVYESLVSMQHSDPDQFAGFDLTIESVAAMWSATYEAIDRWRHDGVLHVADSSLRDRSVLAALSDFVGRPVTAPNVAASLRRSKSTAPTEAERAVFDRCA